MGLSPWPIFKDGEPFRLDKKWQWRGRLGLQPGPGGNPEDIPAFLISEPMNIAPATSPFKGWAINYEALAAVAEMAAQKEVTDCISTNIFPRWDDRNVRFELDTLEALMQYREGIMAEAVTQSTSIIPYFQGLVGFTDVSHRDTTNLCIIAEQLADFSVMLFKKKFNRRRPSELRPALLPPLAVPGHASYPSGHATEAHLIAQLLAAVITPTHDAERWLSPLANRIAINREVMGLHYRSDSEAGRYLAEYIYHDVIKPIIDRSRDHGMGLTLQVTFDRATKEWP